MMTFDIPIDPSNPRKQIDLRNLLTRAKGPERASWLDLSSAPGIYVVRWVKSESPVFLSDAGEAAYATTKPQQCLESKWDRINQNSTTDIIYIGKGDSLKKRIRLLVMFGVGRRRNHKGGEWMWQIENIDSSELVSQTCPLGKQVGFENALLERFIKEHGDVPLANRYGPKVPDRWLP